MESNKDYQRDDMIFEMVVWLFVIAVIFVDIKATFQLPVHRQLLCLATLSDSTQRHSAGLTVLFTLADIWAVFSTGS